jgi:hypothetical protein
VTRQKYQKRLEKFFDFLRIEGSTVEDKSKSFINRIQLEENNNNKQWVYNGLIKFMQFHLDGVNSCVNTKVHPLVKYLWSLIYRDFIVDIRPLANCLS